MNEADRDKAQAGTGKSPPARATPSEADLSEKLRSIEARLSDIRSQSAPAEPSSGRLTADGTAMGRGMKMVSEFVGGIVAGGLLGWIIDRLLPTAPFGLLIGLLFGFAAGLRNLYRATQSQPKP
jgi:ATP synthase protein I